MTDELENKLLKGCKRNFEIVGYSSLFICGEPLDLYKKRKVKDEVVYCERCKSAIKQHRQTKKWIEGLIENLDNLEFINVDGNTARDLIKKELKKQILGIIDIKNIKRVTKIIEKRIGKR